MYMSQVAPPNQCCLCSQSRRRVISVVEQSSANPKVPGSIPGLSDTGVMDYDEACFMHLTPGMVHNFPKAVAV